VENGRVQPETHYAKAAGDLNIGYQVVGDGPLDLVFVPGIVSHLDLLWSSPQWVHFATRLASFARVVFFDKRGTGVSDPTAGVEQLDARMDDIRAVMDAVGMDSAAIFAISEGGPLGILFAATYPERVTSLALYGTGAHMPDDPAHAEALADAFARWGEGKVVSLLAPGVKDGVIMRFTSGLIERAMASPRMAQSLYAFMQEADVRAVLPTVRAPTIVLHRRNEFLPIESGRELAAGIPGAKFVELEGIDHVPWFGDVDALIDPIEEFFTGQRRVAPEPDRTLATVMFTDIASSTEKNVNVGDDQWRRTLDRHNATIRSLLEEYRGREVKTIGDGFLCVFDGPARALRCAKAVVEQVRDHGVEVRAGVHTGELELYPDGDVGGTAVNIGARVEAEARPGEVLVSSTVKDLVIGSRLRFSARGSHRLKGLPGEWALWSFDGEAAPDQPVEHPLDAMGPVSRASVKFMLKRPKLARRFGSLVYRAE
jgi:class 3 adenylate cyclase/pimeloyl-ACP methyl ester carboxylesterase